MAVSGISELTVARRTDDEVSGGKVVVSEADAVTIGTVVTVASGVTVVTGSSRLILSVEVSVGVGEGRRKGVGDVRAAIGDGCEVDTVVVLSTKLGDGVVTTTIVETSETGLNEGRRVVAGEENNSVRVSVGEMVNSAVKIEELVPI